MIRVLYRNVLRKREVNGAVRSRESGKLNRVNGDNGVFGFENSEVNDEDYNEDED